MRKIGSGRGLVSAYPRQLESLIRLSEAHAKMRFSNSVEIVDVEEAKRLHREALKQSATDPKTGIIDVGILTTGVSASERDRRRELAKELKRMLQVSYNSYLRHFFVLDSDPQISILYSRKYWRELNLAVEPKIAITRIIGRSNLAVRYGIAIRIYARRKIWRL